MTYKLNKLSAALLGVSALITATSASASNGIMAYGNGMVAHGVGGAGVANASEVMSATDNPALLARVGGGWAVGTSLFNPNAAANVGTGYVESEADFFVVPQAGWYKAINDNMVAGISISALGGIATDYPAKLLGAAVDVELAGIIVAPAISMQVNDAVSVGAAINFGFTTFDTKGPGVGGLPRNEEDSASGIGFEIGAAFDVGPNTTIGIDYQSEIDFDEFDNHATYLLAAASDAQLTLPALTTIGIVHQFNDQWKVIADVTDAPWSSIEVIDQVFHWNDQTIYKIGFEKQVSDDLAIRFGYNHGDSPVDDAHVSSNILAPAISEDHYTIGFTKQLANGSLSGYYANVPSNEQSQLGGPGGFPMIKMDQHALGLAYTVQF